MTAIDDIVRELDRIVNCITELGSVGAALPIDEQIVYKQQHAIEYARLRKLFNRHRDHLTLLLSIRDAPRAPAPTRSITTPAPVRYIYAPSTVTTVSGDTADVTRASTVPDARQVTFAATTKAHDGATIDTSASPLSRSDTSASSSASFVDDTYLTSPDEVRSCLMSLIDDAPTQHTSVADRSIVQSQATSESSSSFMSDGDTSYDSFSAPDVASACTISSNDMDDIATSGDTYTSSVIDRLTNIRHRIDQYVKTDLKADNFNSIQRVMLEFYNFKQHTRDHTESQFCEHLERIISELDRIRVARQTVN